MGRLTREVKDLSDSIKLSQDISTACMHMLGDLLDADGHNYICVFLQGPLGIGKTEICRRIIKGFGVEDDITSPTYGLIQEYEATTESIGKPCYIVHLDAYRLKTPDELIEIGINDYLAKADIILVEWGEKCGSMISPDLLLEISVPATTSQVAAENQASKEERFIRLKSLSPTGTHLLNLLGS